MSKKNIVLMFNLLVFSVAAVLPMTNEEQLRCEHIRRLSKANALGIAQYIENGAFNQSLIERDIEILKKDSQQAIKDKSWAEGYFYSWMIPGFGKSVVVGSGLSSLIMGVGTGVGSVLAYNVLTSSSVAHYVGKFASFEDKVNFLMNQSDYNKVVLTAAPALPITFVATLILGIVAKYSSNKLSHYKDKNVAFIQEAQERYSCNQVAIAQLQQLVYDVTVLR